MERGFTRLYYPTPSLLYRDKRVQRYSSSGGSLHKDGNIHTYDNGHLSP